MRAPEKHLGGIQLLQWRVGPQLGLERGNQVLVDRNVLRVVANECASLFTRLDRHAFDMKQPDASRHRGIGSQVAKELVRGRVLSALEHVLEPDDVGDAGPDLLADEVPEHLAGRLRADQCEAVEPEVQEERCDQWARGSDRDVEEADHAAEHEEAAVRVGLLGVRAEQERARAEGRLVGIGLVNTIEPGVFDWNAYAIVGQPGTGVPEGTTIVVDPFGKITCKVGFSLEGQGQYTVAAQLLADWFKVGMEDVRVVALDSVAAPPHFGPGGSRLGVALTGAILGACQMLTEKMLKVASGLLQTPLEACEFYDGVFRIKGMPEACVTLADIAGCMFAGSHLLPEDVDPNPEATYVWTAPGRTPADEEGRAKSYLTAANACHLVLVEVDAETGMVEIKGYWIADDCGTRLNPANVEGMTQGGVAQGVGAALLEEYVYDDDGQLLTSTFMDYLLPTIYEVPMTEKRALCTPSPFTPLGAKGAGEGSMHTTPAAVVCAINDAIAHLGVRALEMPAAPRRVWTLLQEAKS